MNCKDCRELMRAYLEGVIDARGVAVMKAHVAECAECGKEFESLRRVEEAVGEAFVAKSATEGGRERVLAGIAQGSAHALPEPSDRSAALVRRLMPLAACLLLAVGVLIGFGVSRLMPPGQTAPGTGRAVPIQVSSLEGTVLVKHAGSGVWQELAQSSQVFIGDVFHSTPKSAVTLSLSDASTVSLAPNGTVSLEEYDGRTKFNLGHGTLKAALNSPHPPFFVATPNGVVEALGTEFTVSVK